MSWRVGLQGFGEVARGGCSLVWNFSVESSAVLTVVGRRSRTGLAKCFDGPCPNCL
jgi:hypothetical protein